MVKLANVFNETESEAFCSYLAHSLAASPAIHPCLNHKLFLFSPSTGNHRDNDRPQSRTLRSHHTTQQPMHAQLLVAFHSLRILTLRVNLKTRKLTAIEIMFQVEIETRRRLFT